MKSERKDTRNQDRVKVEMEDGEAAKSVDRERRKRNCSLGVVLMDRFSKFASILFSLSPLSLSLSLTYMSPGITLKVFHRYCTQLFLTGSLLMLATAIGDGCRGQRSANNMKPEKE